MSWVFVFDGKDTFKQEVDLNSSVASLFKGVAKTYGLPLDPGQHLRLIFADKELRYSSKDKLSNSGIISSSTVAVVFRLPDRTPSLPPAQLQSAPAPAPSQRRKKGGRHDKKKLTAATENQNDNKEIRPTLREIPGVITLMWGPDFIDFSIRLCAVMPCGHMIASEAMRLRCLFEVSNGHFRISCPFPKDLFLLIPCPCEWAYRHVRHVACFTQEEQHDVEKNIATNFIAKDNAIFTCPGCSTWCSKINQNINRLQCFLCTRKTGKEFTFCAGCASDWGNAMDSVSCGNPRCKSTEDVLRILRDCPMMVIAGRLSPMCRLCPRCGLLTEFKFGCSQMCCQSCLYYYCFLCLKGAKTKEELKCPSDGSYCQISSPQTEIPTWDVRSID